MTEPDDPAPPESAVPDCPVVDAHVHLLPDRLFEAIYGWFDAETEWAVPTPDAETVAERATRRTDGFVFFPYAHRAGVARSLNEDAAAWQERLDAAVALGTVHAGDDDPGDVVREAFDAGLRGIKLHCPVQGYPPDDSRLDPVYEKLVARDAPLVIHASTHPFDRGDPDYQPERLQSVLERFPALRICLPHLGLFRTDAYLDLADEYALYFDTAVALGGPARELVGIRESDLPRNRLRDHADRVMFGSDYPIRPVPYEAALRGAADAFPDPEDRRRVFAGTAREFYDLPF